MASLVSELGPAEGELYFLLCKFNTGTTFVETVAYAFPNPLARFH
jgi:hypothetical protein